MKKRTIALMLSVLAVMMLVGVGFATWVVSQGAKTEKTGNLVVETVRDDRLNIVVSPVGEENFNFTAPAEQTVANHWLTGEGNAAEKRTITYHVEVSREDGTAFTAITQANVTAALKEGTDEITLSGLIAQATNFVVVGEKTLSEGKIVCDVTVEYVWGSLFNGQNPYTFFNAKDVAGKIGADLASAATTAGLEYQDNPLTADSTYGDLAVAALKKLEAHQNKTVAITINVELATA